jgi:hypothetical protein
MNLDRTSGGASRYGGMGSDRRFAATYIASVGKLGLVNVSIG